MGPRNIIYTNHAKDRMRQYGISEKDVEYCLNNYDTRYRHRNGNMGYIADLPSGRRIKVSVAENRPSIWLVVTAFDWEGNYGTEA